MCAGAPRVSRERLDEAEVWRVAGEVMSERLDHARPLWTFDLIGPMADGGEVIAARIHHAMADGISCLRLLSGLLWTEDEGEGKPPGRRAAPAGPSPRRSRIAEARRLPGALGRELGARGSRSPFDQPIGAARALGFVTAPLADLRRIAAARPEHVTVNDVLLAVVAGGLREWLGASRRLPHLRAQIPVSLHHRDEGDEGAGLGNRDSFLNVDLPLAEPDPLRRLDLINAETARRKRLGDADELYDFFHAVSRFRHLDRGLERLAGGPREFSLSISNVPGPAGAVSVLGRRVSSLRTVAEPAARHALRISAISCHGEVEIGLCTDPEALPEVAELAAAMADSLAELEAAAG